MSLKYIFKGLATFLPGVNRFKQKGTGGTNSAKYCYSVWLRHLIMAKKSGLNTFPKIVAELGPGDSLGIGLAALISGSQKYFAFDVVEYADVKINLRIFDELVELFKNREAIPGDDDFPKVKPRLSEYSFPADIMDAERLGYALEVSRLERIRESILNPGKEGSVIKYMVPWYDAKVIESGTVDMIYSQAVLEHVEELRNSYKIMHVWLNSNGFMSHTIDFKCHGSAGLWNGHWAYSDFAWKLIKGNKPFWINRQPHSVHTSVLKERFRVISDIQYKLPSCISRERLASKFAVLSDDDLTTSEAFIQAVKK
jgi:hypothetical protein